MVTLKDYKRTSDTKKPGEKTHFFSSFIKNFKGNSGSDNSIEVKVQNVSNDKYLKLYKIDTDLVDYETETLENSLSFFMKMKICFWIQG